MKHYVVPIYELNGKIKSYSMHISPEEINLLETAPDLLEACKEVLDIINSYSHIPAQFKACKILQNAILKAEGGTK